VGRVFSFDITSGPSDAATTLPRDGAIVDQGWAKEHKLGIGDRFSIRSISDKTVALRVVAIEDSPILDPLGLGPITISRAAFDPAFEAHRDYLTLVSTGSGFDPRAAIAAHPDGKLQTKASYVDQQTSGIDQLLAIFYVLLALAVLVSLFGIVNTLVLSTFERTRELGMLRAVGMSRRQVRRMVRHESIITALMGAGLGVLLGLGLAAIVTSAFSDEGLTFAVPVGSLIAFGVVAVIAGVIAAILPARRAARLNVLAALAWE
jgi:putative ABC transport system permease protein